MIITLTSDLLADLKTLSWLPIEKEQILLIKED